MADEKKLVQVAFDPVELLALACFIQAFDNFMLNMSPEVEQLGVYRLFANAVCQISDVINHPDIKRQVVDDERYRLVKEQNDQVRGMWYGERH